MATFSAGTHPKICAIAAVLITVKDMVASMIDQGMDKVDLLAEAAMRDLRILGSMDTSETACRMSGPRGASKSLTLLLVRRMRAHLWMLATSDWASIGHLEDLTLYRSRMRLQNRLLVEAGSAQSRQRSPLGTLQKRPPLQSSAEDFRRQVPGMGGSTLVMEILGLVMDVQTMHLLIVVRGTRGSPVSMGRTTSR